MWLSTVLYRYGLITQRGLVHPERFFSHGVWQVRTVPFDRFIAPEKEHGVVMQMPMPKNFSRSL
jgi:hypothetical protein